VQVEKGLAYLDDMATRVKSGVAGLRYTLRSLRWCLVTDVENVLHRSGSTGKLVIFFYRSLFDGFLASMGARLMRRETSVNQTGREKEEEIHSEE